MVIVISMSIAVFVMESVPQFTIYGEGSEACQTVVSKFCEDKRSDDDFEANRGCFTATSTLEERTPLTFFCSADDDGLDPSCFGVGNNFGQGLHGPPSSTDYYSCYGYVSDSPEDFNLQGWEVQRISESTMTPYTPDGVSTRPFRDQDALPSINDFMWLQQDMNQYYDVCFRQECNNGQYSFGDFRPLWLPLELFFAFVFTFEVLVRFLVSRNMLKFWTDPMNLLDVASVAPFYIEVALSIIEGVPMNFTISSADSAMILLLKILKVTRVFKMTRHFSGTLVLADTFKRSMSKVRPR
jgi:hypothetical protein